VSAPPERAALVGSVSPRASPVDLDALENTRLGLRGIGLGLCLLMIGAAQFVAGSGPREIGSFIGFAGALALGLGLLLCAPTPHGPLPAWLKQAYVVLCLLAALLLARSWFFPVTEEGPLFWRRLLLWSGGIFAAACLLLPWILWRYCQLRGLTGRGLSWLWLALAMTAVSLLVQIAGSKWSGWLFAPLGVFVFAVALQTARDVWLDAISKVSRSR